MVLQERGNVTRKGRPKNENERRENRHCKDVPRVHKLCVRKLFRDSPTDLGEETAMYRENYVTRGLARACPIFYDSRIALPLCQPEGRTRRFKLVRPGPISGERRGPLETAGRLETTREAAENRSPNNRLRKERGATAIPKALQCKDHSDKKKKKKKRGEPIGTTSLSSFMKVRKGSSTTAWQAVC